jgi:uncharacterized protein YabN with tetrapyrrole methylase and pyrophosphatase domain
MEVWAVWEWDCLLAVFATEELAEAWSQAERERGRNDANVKKIAVLAEMPKLVTRYLKTGRATATASVDWDFEQVGERWKDTLEEALAS